MKHMSLRILSAALLVGFFAVSFNAYAAAPDTPYLVQASVLTMSPNDYFVTISWHSPKQSAAADYFTLYHVDSKENDYAKFSKFEDLDVALLDSLRSPGIAGYIYPVKGLSTGWHSFYLTASNNDGTSGNSQIVQVYFRAMPDIHFTTQPPTHGDVNVEYVYDADAISTLGNVKYEAVQVPQGTTVDPVTGVVKYTATTAGGEGFVIRAYLESDSTIEAFQQWGVKFGSNNIPRDCAFFYGTVKYENGDPVPEGVIYAMENGTGSRPFYAFAGQIDQTGHYLVRVMKEGTYILQAEGKTFELEFYQNTIDPTQATPFAVQCSDSTEVNFVVTKRAVKPTIHFITQPSHIGDPNQEYTYDADAVSSDNGTVKYALVAPQSGATLDETTGVLKYTYTPNAAGIVQFAIKAYLDSDPTVIAHQTWIVRFGNDSTNHRRDCAHFYGTVKDANGNPMNHGYVTARLLPQQGNAQFTFSSSLNSNGEYDFYTPYSGSYILSATGPMFQTMWYDNSTSEQNATPVTMHCGDALNADFVVTPVQTYTVSGRVTAADNGDPITATIVGNGSSSKLGFLATTDAQGYYTITVPENTTLYLRAEPLSNEFYPEFYDNATSMSTATAIVVDANKTDIDFKLARRPVYQNGLAGQVLGENHMGVMSMVAAYRIEYRGTIAWLDVQARVATDSLGYFSVSNLEPGDYIVRAYNVPIPFVPGYYKENSTAVPFWGDATTIAVSATGVISGVDIQLAKRNGIRGNFRFRGVIRLLVHGAAGDDVLVNDAFVQLIDNNGNISGYAVTNDVGEFEIDGVAPGSYVLLADHVGYDAYYDEVVLEFQDNEPYQYDIEMKTLGTTDVEEPASAVNFMMNVFPNPATSQVSLLYTGDRTAAVATVYNHLGSVIYSQEIDITEQNNIVSYNTAKLPAGTYYMSVQGSGFSKTVPFSVIR